MRCLRCPVVTVPESRQLAEEPLRDVLDGNLSVRGGEVELVAGDDDGHLLEVRPLLANFLQTVLHRSERWRRCHGIHQQEGVGRRDAQAPHGWELHVSCRIQDVHLHDNKASEGF